MPTVCTCVHTVNVCVHVSACVHCMFIYVHAFITVVVMCAYECCVYVCYMHTCVCIVFLMCVCEGTCALCVYACMHVLMFAF